MLMKRAILGAAMALAMATPVLADEMQWVGVNGAVWGADGVYYYVSPYEAYDTVRGVNLRLYCIDFDDDAAAAWAADIRSLSQRNTPQFLHGSFANAFPLYLEAAWLIEDSLKQHELIVHQLAVWTLFDDGQPHRGVTLARQIADSGYDDRVLEALRSAEHAVFPAVGQARWQPALAWSVVTGDPQWQADHGRVQEFMTATPAPEPGTAFLFGAGMVLLMIGRGRHGGASR